MAWTIEVAALMKLTDPCLVSENDTGMAIAYHLRTESCCTSRMKLVLFAIHRMPTTKKNMHAILVHGMGRTPLSQVLLAKRLRNYGFTVHLFGYSTLQSFNTCVVRLAERARVVCDTQEQFILVGHSLGCVLIRATLPVLEPIRPASCFFLAPPSRVTKSARFFARNWLYRLVTRECGQLLANEGFMESLPVPSVPVRVYAGTGGYKGKFSPFEHEENDGVLAVSETMLNSDHDVVRVPAIHTFIMNSAALCKDIAATMASLRYSA
jgi:hypothetical protein